MVKKMYDGIDKDDEQYFDDILKIFEEREKREGNFDVDNFIDSYVFDDETEELEDTESYDEIKWIKENPADEEFIASTSFKSNSFGLPSYFVVDKQEEETFDIEEFFERFSKEQDSIKHTNMESPRISKKVKTLDNVLSRLNEGICSVIEYLTDEERIAKLAVGLFIVGYCTLNTIDAKLNNVHIDEWKRANSNANTKHEESVEEERTYSNTTFVQKEDGNITNNILETDVYKEFEEYARSNNLVMNIENFEYFCDHYYNESTNGRGRQ